MSVRHASKWSDPDIARIKRMWDAGIRIVSIALAFPNRSREAVETMLSKMTSAGTLIPRKKARLRRNPRLDALFTRAVTGGIGIPALCDIFRRDETLIYEWKRELGLTGVYLPKPPETTPRPCLGWCGKMHDSIGCGDRFCSPCKDRKGWSGVGCASVVGAIIHER